MKKWTIMAAMAIMFFHIASAQRTNRQEYSKIDEYVASVGPMQGSHLKTIVDSLTKRRTLPQADQVRAIYMWIANNVTYSTVGKRHPNNFNPTASEALNTRETTDEGYANLFKAMLDMAHIRSAVIKGMAKFDPRNIGKISEKWNKHTWNAVEVKGKWYLVDLAWSVGRTDRKFRTFTKAFTDAWYMTDKELFAMTHYPKDKKWQLLDTPVNKSVFTQAPIIRPAAVINEVYPVSAKRGNVRGKADTTKKMIFEVGNPDLIKSVAVSARTSERIPVKYTFQDNLMYLDVPFDAEGDYSFNIYINDDIAYMYQADVSKARKRPAPRPQAKAKSAQKSPAKKQIAENRKQKNESEKKQKEKSKKEKNTEDKTKQAANL
ncbi:MAG: transglutaminase protein [Flavipsychrobacter sp.]|nr:transglutaminase protein [Flavipsychrobacter sp.]